MFRRLFHTGPPIAISPRVESTSLEGAPCDGLRAWLAQLELREALRLDDAELVSLELARDHGRPYTLLHEALAKGSVIVSEQGQGRVNALAITNKGPEPVLVLEGELVVGAKQNRAITETLLVGAGATVPVSVGCVERGRWASSQTPFESAPYNMDPSCRSATLREMVAHGELNQSRLWSNVEERSRDFAKESATGDYVHVAEERHEQARKQVLDVPESPTRVGMMVLLGGRFVGLDVVSHPRTWAALEPRLLPSYFVGLDVMRRHPELLRSTARATPAEWLGAATLGEVRSVPSAGLGERLLLRSGTMNGAGLWHGDHPAHLALFAE